MQSDIEVLEKLRSKFVNFPPIFKNTLVSNSDIGDLMKNYAEEERLLFQPRKMLVFTIQNGTPITPVLLFYLKVGLVCTKIHRFFEYTPKNASTVLCTHQWTHEGKVTEIQTHVLSQKQ